MIIIITGATHTGKTKLAQRLLETFQYPYLSIDHLKMGCIKSGYTDLTVTDDAALTDYLWPIVREMIKTAVENKQNLIVEGCYIPFGWKKDFDDPYLPFIRYICLAMTDGYIESHFEEIKMHGSDIENRMEDDMFCTIEQLKMDNRAIIQGSRAHGNPVTVIDSVYEPVFDKLVESLRKPQE